MKLLVTPAKDFPSQKFRIKSNRRPIISRMALWVYAHNIGSGDTFKFSIYSSKESRVIATKTLTGSEIKTLCGVTMNYFHAKLFVAFSSDVMLEKGYYKVTAEQLTGYSSSNFLALCRDWERPFGDVSPIVNEIWQSPYYLRLYDLEGREL